MWETWKERNYEDNTAVPKWGTAKIKEDMKRRLRDHGDGGQNASAADDRYKTRTRKLN